MSTRHAEKRKAAIIGSGNIGTDLLVKMLRTSQTLTPALFVGIERESDGLQRAARLGVPVTHEGLEGLLAHESFRDIAVVFDATSAKAHVKHAGILREAGKRVVDLTPAAIGPFAVPVVNLAAHASAWNVNMTTCGGQATIPVVWAMSRVATVHWAEIVASIASKSAGPGTRANIDEFTTTTSRALEQVGGAARAKAIIVLNPADPPVIMRDTVYGLCEGASEEELRASIHDVVAQVRAYVPGYRLLKEPVFERFLDKPVFIPGSGHFRGLKVTCFLEVEGAAHYLPKYAGNLDIMTSAALRMGEAMALA